MKIAATVLLAVVLAVLLAGLGFAHRPGTSSSDARLAAYVSAGGSLSDLCDADGSAGFHRGLPCDACRLAGVAILPDAPPLPGADAHSPVPRLGLGGTGRGPAFLRDPSRGVRAPPAPGFYMTT
jgi:hypothetical protein